MRIGILGSGNIGGRLGVQWAAAGHHVVFSSRHPERLGELVNATQSKARAAMPREAAEHGEVLLLAVPYYTIDEILASAGSLDGKIVIDATNPYTRDHKGWAVPDDTTALAVLQAKLPSARVVKAFNTMFARILSDEAKREDRYVVFLSGADPSAKQVVGELISDAGFIPYDLGGVSEAALQEPRGPLYAKTFTRVQADDFLRANRAGASGR